MHRKKGDENAPGGKGVKGFVINITPTVFNFDQSKQTGEQMSSLLFGHLKGKDTTLSDTQYHELLDIRYLTWKWAWMSFSSAPSFPTTLWGNSMYCQACWEICSQWVCQLWLEHLWWEATKRCLSYCRCLIRLNWLLLMWKTVSIPRSSWTPELLILSQTLRHITLWRNLNLAT